MTGLDGRVRRLEGRSSTGRPCPKCCIVPGEPVEEIEVVWHDLDGAPGEASPVEAGDADDARPEWCEHCGEQTVYVVGWLDPEPHGPDDPGEGGS